jgi:creatinine amidohydrolase
LRQKGRSRGDLLLLSTTYWTLGGKPNEIDPSIKQTQMGHACEYETSMMLRIAPHLVIEHTKVAEVPFGTAFAPAHRAWITKDRTEPGHIGNPCIATAEKGETIYRVFTADVVKFLERVVAWDGKTWDA